MKATAYTYGAGDINHRVSIEVETVRGRCYFPFRFNRKGRRLQIYELETSAEDEVI